MRVDEFIEELKAFPLDADVVIFVSEKFRDDKPEIMYEAESNEVLIY